MAPSHFRMWPKILMESFIIPTHFYPTSSPACLSWHSTFQIHYPTSLSRFIFKYEGGERVGVKWTIFSKHWLSQGKVFQSLLQNGLWGYESQLPSLCMLFWRYWERSFEYQNHNINISDLGINDFMSGLHKT